MEVGGEVAVCPSGPLQGQSEIRDRWMPASAQFFPRFLLSIQSETPGRGMVPPTHRVVLPTSQMHLDRVSYSF